MKFGKYIQNPVKTVIVPKQLFRWKLPMTHFEITSKKKLFQNFKKVTYFGIFQEMLHFYLNSAILLSYYREISKF